MGAGGGERRVEYRPLAAIAAAPRNPKRHADAEIGASLDRFGLAELPLIDDRTGRLVAGHGRIDRITADHRAGKPPPEGVRVGPDGQWLVPVTCGWASRSDAEAEAYLVTSNMLGALGGWHTDLLDELMADLGDVDPELLEVTGYAAQLDALAAPATAGGGGGGPGGHTDPDDAPDPPADPISAPGDLWHLGPHRLLCGDATNPDHIARVLADLGPPGIVYTDPPYGISIVSGDGKVGDPRGSRLGATCVNAGTFVPTTPYAPVAGDETTDIARDAFRLALATWSGAVQVWWGGNHYTASAGLPDARCWLVWDKDTNGYFADAELAWTNHPGAVRLLRHMWNGMLRATERGKRVHPTQKPVALAEWAFTVVDRDVGRRVVLDLFGGSGSTLIAAHTTGRAAAVIEVVPAYVDVICRRYQEHTGVTPVRALPGGGGEAIDFTGRIVDESTNAGGADRP